MTKTETASYYSHQRAELARIILPSSYERVLEIGCGNGAFASHYISSSEKWGVEPHREAATHAQQSFDKVLIGTYRDVEADLPENYFDLVICNDVIEHMPDAFLFLKEIQKRMSSNARLAGSIPNVRYYRNLLSLIVRREWKYEEEGTLDRTHSVFFTKRSLSRALKEAGYRIELLHGLNEAHSAYPANKLRKLKRALLRAALAVTGQADAYFFQFAFRAVVTGCERAEKSAS